MSCTCLTKSAWGRFGHRLPMDEYGQWRYGPSKRVRGNDLRPGDIVFFAEGGGRLTHVGIYSGRGNLVHASRYFGKVVESEMRYIKGYSGAIRLKPR
jgi:cell wall-associated NlpC family hydrolase